MAILLIVCISSLMSPFIPRKYYRLFGLLVSCLLAYFAFHIDVPKVTDLYRHYGEISLYRQVGFDLFLDDLSEMRNPLTYVLYYVFSLVEDNRWFQTTIIFVIYYLIFKLLYNISVDENLTQKQFALCTTFVLVNFNFYLAVYAVRMWLAFAIFAFCLYTETVRNKFKVLCWIIYIALLFFHYATFFLLLARIIAFFIMNPPTTLEKILLTTLMTIAVIICFYYMLNSGLGEVMQDKFEGYLSYNIRGTWQTIICLIRAFAVFSLALYQLLQIKNYKLKCISVTVVMIFITIILFIENYQITLRFPDGLILLSACLIAAFVKPHKAAYSYPLWQLILICVTIFNAIYLLIFDYRQMTFIF